MNAYTDAPTNGLLRFYCAGQATIRHEKPLVLHMCQLLLGFTRADTYFSSLDEGFYFMEAGLELPEYTIEQFSLEMDALLSLTVRSKVVEKLAVALNAELFNDGKVLESHDHQAIIAVHGYLQVHTYIRTCINVKRERERRGRQTGRQAGRL